MDTESNEQRPYQFGDYTRAFVSSIYKKFYDDTEARSISDDTPIYGVFGSNEEAVEGYSLPLRHKGVTELHSKPVCGSSTIRELIENSIQRSFDRPAVGSRPFVKTWSIEENGKKFEKLEFENRYEWLTYQQFGCQIRDFMAGLVHVAGAERHARMLLYAETQVEWMIAAIAAISLGMEVATTYATLGADAALHALNQTEASICVVHPKLVKNLLTIAPNSKYLKHIISFVPVDEVTITAFQSAGVESVHGFNDILTAGRKQGVGREGEIEGERETEVSEEKFEHFDFESHCPVPDDNAVIMYTSGTTGAPKGVQLSHKNLLAASTGFMEMASMCNITPDNRMFAYLPLAHIMEMIAEFTILALGASMGYGSPHTMINSSVKLKRPETDGDCVVLKPSFIVFAPAVLVMVYKSVLAQVDKTGGVSKWFFDKALHAGEEGFDKGQVGSGWLYNKAFSSVQAALGGEIKFAISGSAPLSPDVQKFIQTVFNAPVRQGYGLTECCACASLGDFHDNSVKNVGAPLTCAVIRLADWPEGGYFAADIDNPEIGMARGEILLGGPTVTRGYFISEKEPDEAIMKKNEEDFVVVGGETYFRTGDIGQALPNGTIQVIDRKKDLWKGPQGEYVSLSKVEAALKLSPFVDMALAHGIVGGDYVVALVMCMPHPIQDVAEKEEIVGTVEELCNHPRIIEVATASFREACGHGLVAFETPKKFTLLPPGSWTPENDMLTAALKLKRPQIAKAHQEQLAAML